jgi:two-component system cell cycle response regulator CpdR
MAKILIAEDDSSMRHFLSAALQKAGHSVESCADGLEAINLIQATQDGFDLLLADIVMPGMDGIELSQRAARILPGMKVMFITGFAGVAMNKGNALPDTQTILSKPFHLKELVDRVETLLKEAA